MNISEKELEDYICEYPEIVQPSLYIIDRQAQLPHGRLDILGMMNDRPVVMELKAGALREKDVGQILRYRHDMLDLLTKRSFDAPWERLNEEGEFEPQSYRERVATQEWYRRHGTCGPSPNGYPVIYALLIGASVDEYTYTAALGGEIDVALWHCDEDGIFITWPEIDTETWWSRSALPQWTDAVSHLLHGICWEQAEDELQDIADSLFTGEEN